MDLTGFIAYRILRRFKSELDLFRTKKDTGGYRSSTAGLAQQNPNDDLELPDCMLYPQQYDSVKMKNFTCMDYNMRASLVICTLSNINVHNSYACISAWM